ncbi:hypothetical protein AB0A95_30520 [Micromonospora sp. NPDC049230]|uniref:hypothetical protein n=1 Tax=Micromonospora sp. NPDC049230 TaxID=3155502 RepID=UPI0033D88FD7
MTTTEQALAGARRLGERAAQRQVGLAACPYPADGTPQQEACRQAWLRTYRYWRPGEAAPVDYGDDVTALAEGTDEGQADDTPADPATSAAQGVVVPRGGNR